MSTLRTGAAIGAGAAVAHASRLLRRGSGEVIGGKVIERLDPLALHNLADGRSSICVSATNGKTTTTRLLTAALTTRGTVASNSGGANMTAGVITALARRRDAHLAALEVDEIFLPPVARAVQPQAVVLMNLSRDQLDRSNETRRIASLWRSLGAELPSTTAVANADDPLVAWAAMGFREVVWVGAGQVWTADAMVCPACAALLRRSGEDWWCPRCDLRRPTPSVTVDGLSSISIDGVPHHVELALPGRCNIANAAMAAAAAGLLGIAPDSALHAMREVGSVEGRYSTQTLAPDRMGRLLLAKNPAGWAEMLELLDLEPPRGCLIAFHSRIADGRDPSWIWDVPLERLAGRPVAVWGERAADMSLRLSYAGVEHSVHNSVRSAALALPAGGLDVIATYTAFREIAFGVGPR